MFNKIYNNRTLFGIISSACSENGIEVSLCKELEYESDERLIILKTDAYYSTTVMTNPPPSVDCLVLIKCKNNSNKYSLNLVELRNINSPKGFDKENIKKKFETVINDFLNDKFKDIFLNEEYYDFNCYFVTNPYNLGGMSDDEYSKKIHSESLKLDFFSSLKPFRFKDKISYITPKLPDPILEDC